MKSSRIRDLWPAGILALVTLIMTGAFVCALKPAYFWLTDCTPYLIQASIFGDGKLSRPAPPEDIRPFFRTVGMFVHDGREFSRQPPGASAMLALLTPIVKDVRLVPPLLSGLAVALNFLWIRRTHDRRTAVLAVCLCLSQPNYLALASASLSYAPSALLVSAAMLFFAIGLQRSSVVYMALCGLVVGLQFCVRPYSAVLTIVWLATTRLVLFRKTAGGLSQGLAFCVGLLPGVASLLMYNHVMMGSPWTLPFTVSEPYDRLGFGVRGWGPVRVDHTPAAALTNLFCTVNQLLSPPFVLWLPVVVWLVGRCVTRRRSPIGKLTGWDLCCLLFVLLLMLGHMLYWYPRFVNYFDTFPFLAVLIVRGATQLAERGRLIRWCMILGAVGVVASTVVVVIGWYRENTTAIRPIFRTIENARREDGRLLLFVRPVDGLLGDAIENLPVSEGMSLGFYNLSLDSDEPILYAVDRGPENARLAGRYPDRRPYVLEFPGAGRGAEPSETRPTLLPLRQGAGSR